MYKNVDIAPTDYKFNSKAHGHVKVWQFDSTSGDKKLLVDKDNLILKSGADIMAAALTGAPNSKITHFYVGYTVPATTPGSASIAIDSRTSDIFTTDGSHGYLRIPLAFPACFMQEAGYNANVPYFTTFLTNGGAYDTYGAPFTNGAHLYLLGLVNAQNPSGANQDRLFSAISFGPITYDSSHGLAITWGVTFRAV